MSVAEAQLLAFLAGSILAVVVVVVAWRVGAGLGAIDHRSINNRAGSSGRNNRRVLRQARRVLRRGRGSK